jgi:hypothetical protein
MARPTKFDAEAEQRILMALRAGNTRKAASGYGRVDQDTLERWMKRYADFADRVKLAEAEAYVTVFTRLIAAVQAGEIAAMKFWLERRHPEEWGPPRADSRVDLSVTEAELVKVTINFDRANELALLDGTAHNGTVR